MSKRSNKLADYRIGSVVVVPGIGGKEAADLAQVRIEETLATMAAKGEITLYEVRSPARGKATFQCSEKASGQLELPLVADEGKGGAGQGAQAE